MKARSLIGILVVTVAIGVLGASPAFGWSNGDFGGGGYGTHDWVLQQANRIAGSEGWVDLAAALPMTDDPDNVLRDWNHHTYDVWGTYEGDAPDYIASLFATAVAQLREAGPTGDKTAASRTVGLLAHYYADINQPMHTDSSSAETTFVHLLYELKIDSYNKTPTQNQSWVVFDGIPITLEPRAASTAAATTAHGSYSQLVSTYSRYGYNTTVAGITKTQLNRAANGLADIIAHIQRAAWQEPARRSGA